MKQTYEEPSSLQRILPILLVGIGLFVLGTAMRPAKAADVIQRSFTLRFRSPQRIADRVQDLLSSSGRVQIIPSKSLLTVADKQERVDAIERMVHRLDIPYHNMELIVKLLKGEKKERNGQDDSRLPEVIRKMRKFLNFDHYKVLESASVKTVEMKPVLLQLGEYRLRFTGEWAVEPREIIRLADLEFDRRSPERQEDRPKGVESEQALEPRYQPILRTTLNLRTGEPTVVGTARSESSDSMLILLLQVRLIDREAS